MHLCLQMGPGEDFPSQKAYKKVSHTSKMSSRSRWLMCASHGGVMHCRAQNRKILLFLLGLPRGWDSLGDNSPRMMKWARENGHIRALSMQKEGEGGVPKERVTRAGSGRM